MFCEYKQEAYIQFWNFCEISMKQTHPTSYYYAETYTKYKCSLKRSYSVYHRKGSLITQL
jgi:hypothetical protein